MQISKLSLDYQGIWYRQVVFFKKIQKYIENLIEHNLGWDTEHDKDNLYYPKKHHELHVALLNVEYSFDKIWIIIIKNILRVEIVGGN